ncbi:MAG: hypothetical protein EXS32_14455 [Opitutus sp.]|nr:hypothetical protein [Opitutus sp.]
MKSARDSAASAAVSGPRPAAPGGAATPADDSRLAKLTADNVRLNEEVKRSTIQLSNLNRQLREAQGKVAKSGESPASGSPPAAGDDRLTADLTRQVGELRAANLKLLADNNRLQSAGPAKADAASQSAATELANLTQRFATTQAELLKLRTETARLREGSQAAGANLSTLQLRAARAEQTLADSDQVRLALAADKARLEAHVAELSAARPATGRPDNAPQLAKLQGELEKTQSDLATSRRATEELRIELTKTQETMAAKSSPAAADPAPLNQLKRELAAAQQAESMNLGEITKLTAQLEAANRSLTQTGQSAGELVAARAQLAGAQDELSAARRAAADLRTQLATAQETLAAKASQPAESANLSEISKLRTQLDGANRSLAQSSQLAIELAAVRAQLAARQAQALIAGTAGQDALTAKASQLTAELERTKQALASSEANRADPAQLSQLKRDLAAAQQADSANLGEIARLRTQLEGANRSLGQSSQSAGELVTLRSQLADVQAKLAAAQRGQTAAASTQLADQRTLNQQLAQTNATLTTRLDAITAERDKLVATQRAESADRDAQRGDEARDDDHSESGAHGRNPDRRRAKEFRARNHRARRAAPAVARGQQCAHGRQPVALERQGLGRFGREGRGRSAQRETGGGAG